MGRFSLESCSCSVVFGTNPTKELDRNRLDSVFPE